MAAPAAAVCGGSSSDVAASGQLSEGQFQAAMVLFSQWWHEAFPEQPAWVLQQVVLPVTEQVVHSLQLERVVGQPAEPLQSSSTPALQAGQVDAGSAAPGQSCSQAASAAHTCKEQHQTAPPPATAAPAGGVPGSPAAACEQRLGGLDSSPATAASAGDAASDDDGILEVSDDAVSLPAEPAGSAAPACAAQQPWVQCAMHKYSVVWHEIYRVPVLYLAACRADGCPLSLPQLCGDLPQLMHYQDAGQASWTYLTTTAHPVTSAPCFMLHPCQTAARMQLLLQPAPAEQGYANSMAGLAAGSAAVGAAGDSSQGQAADPAELLAYARGWFSMVLPLLGMSLLPPQQ